MNKKPNIVWFVADQMRADSLAHLGNPASFTPNLDQLCTEGASFTGAYCQNPVCVPSRCSFLTGLHPHTLGHRTMHFMMRPEDPNIMKTMKQNGYEVIWIGRNDFIPSSWKKSDYCDKFYDGTDLIEKSAVEGGKLSFGINTAKPTIAPVMHDASLQYSFYTGCFEPGSLDDTFDWNCVNAALKELDERESDKPFFLYVTLSFPHPPYGCEDPWYSLIDRDKIPPRRPDIETLENKSSILRSIRAKQNMQDWQDKHYREMQAVYLGMVARFDHQLGLLCDKLKEKGLYDDSAIFVFSDHGDLTGDYGIAEKCQNSFEDPLTNVPLVVKLPKEQEVIHGINDNLAQLADLPATVYDLCGITPDYIQFGKSMLPSLQTGKPYREAVFCEGGRLDGEVQAMEPLHGPASPYWPRISTQHESVEAHGKGIMVRKGNLKYVHRLYGENELYDLEQDQMELENRFHDPLYAADVLAMKGILLDHFMETGDFVPTQMDKR